nr:hypothetical protein [Tanacetum cinerariifolium]
MMSLRGSIVASFENVESFFAVHTPPDHLIRADFKQKGVVPKIVSLVFEKLVFLLGRHSLNDKVTRVSFTSIMNGPKVFFITLPQDRTYGEIAGVAHKFKWQVQFRAIKIGAS